MEAEEDAEQLEKLLISMGTINTDRISHQLKREREYRARVSLKQRQYEYPEQAYCQQVQKSQQPTVTRAPVRFQISKNGSAATSQRDSTEKVKVAAHEPAVVDLKSHEISFKNYAESRRPSERAHMSTLARATQGDEIYQTFGSNATSSPGSKLRMDGLAPFGNDTLQ